MSLKVRLLPVLAALLLYTAEKARSVDPEPATDTAPPKADVRGEVTRVAALRAKGLIGSLLVEGKKEKDTQHDKASVTLPQEVKIFKWTKGKKVEAKFDDIKKGDQVQCVFTGPVAESYPVQAKASEVLILPAAKK